MLWAGNKAGHLLRWEINKPAEPAEMLRSEGHNVRSLVLLRRGEYGFLFWTNDQPVIYCRLLEDDFSWKFHCQRRVRYCWARGDLLAGASASGDQVFLWQFSKPGHPYSVLSAARRWKIHVHDVCLTSETRPRKKHRGVK
jgi:hypothetical protein